MKLTKKETSDLIARMQSKLDADKTGYSVCAACGRPLTSSEMNTKGWLSGQVLGLCHSDGVHVNNHLLVDFQEQLGYND